MTENDQKLIRCQKCISLYGNDNALVATEHGIGILVPEYHLCAEHYLERYGQKTMAELER
jgi:hypothetical protein